MIRFALTEMLDEQACYNYLLKALHPRGLHCPLGHPLPPSQAPHSVKDNSKYRRMARLQLVRPDYRGPQCQDTIWSLFKVDYSFPFL
jgi:hypothetical protein